VQLRVEAGTAEGRGQCSWELWPVASESWPVAAESWPIAAESWPVAAESCGLVGVTTVKDASVDIRLIYFPDFTTIYCI
jgi:hypothetical protein